MYNEIK